MASIADVRRIALSLPRSYEALVRDHVKFRVGRIVWASVSPDDSLMGFAYPKEGRASLVASDPDRFRMPIRSDERYNWARVVLATVDEEELRELLVDAWTMCVPRKVAAAYFDGLPDEDHPEDHTSDAAAADAPVGRRDRATTAESPTRCFTASAARNRKTCR
jgi:hypothetical protein